MQSVHAGACFVRVGRCCLGSILGSILESFWEPGGALYSFWGASALFLDPLFKDDFSELPRRLVARGVGGLPPQEPGNLNLEAKSKTEPFPQQSTDQPSENAPFARPLCFLKLRHSTSAKHTNEHGIRCLYDTLNSVPWNGLILLCVCIHPSIVTAL